MKNLVRAAALLAAVLAPGVAAQAQYVGPFQRDYRGVTCPGSTVYQGGTCVDTGGYAQDDWRKQRDRALEERERTAGDRMRDDWRVQRQRELDDRYGK